MLNIYKFSTNQYNVFSERHISGNPTPEEIQKEKLLAILKSINDSLLKESETMSDFIGMGGLDASMTGHGKNLSLANKRLSYMNPLIKHFEPNSQTNKIKLPGEEDSSDEDSAKRRRRAKKEAAGNLYLSLCCIKKWTNQLVFFRRTTQKTTGNL